MARRIGSVVYTGPFFERNPSRTLRQNMKALVRWGADAGAALVRQRLAPGRGSALAAYVRATVHEQIVGGGSLYGAVRSTMQESLGERASWATWAERGTRRLHGQPYTSPNFKGWRAYTRTVGPLRRLVLAQAQRLLPRGLG